VILAVLPATVLAMITACSPPTISSAPEHIAARRPDHPITLTLLDGSGDLRVYQKIYQDFAKTHPDLVGEIRFVTAFSPDVLGKVRAQELKCGTSAGNG